MKILRRNPPTVVAHNEPTAPPAALDREAVAVLRELAAERLAERDRGLTHDPCSWCGLASSPPWRGPGVRRDTFVCGRCATWVDTFDTVDPRDLAASVLAGITTPTRHARRDRLGELVGLAFFDETGRNEPNPSPWHHVDVPALRREVVELAQSRRIPSLPPRWHPNVRVTW